MSAYIGRVREPRHSRCPTDQPADCRLIDSLRAARIRANLSQQAVAAQVGVTQQALAGWEAHRSPSPQRLDAWRTALGTTGQLR